jgi:hypothetical protein
MKPKFYQAVLTEIKSDIMRHVYPTIKNLSLEDRLPNNGECSTCGGNEWYLLPKESVAVVQGGKPYIECLHCGNITHL